MKQPLTLLNATSQHSWKMKPETQKASNAYLLKGDMAEREKPDVNACAGQKRIVEEGKLNSFINIVKASYRHLQRRIWFAEFQRTECG